MVSLKTVPAEAAPLLGIAVSDSCFRQQGGIPTFLSRIATDELREIARKLAETEFDTMWVKNCVELELGEPMSEGPSWWVTDVLPCIKSELERRNRPKKVYSGNSPIAKLKQLDLATVASQYTELRPSGQGRLRGLCPLHQERTPSFYVFEDSQKWRCFVVQWNAPLQNGSPLDSLR